MPRKSKKYETLLKVTEQFLRGRSFKPLTEQEIMDRLNLPDKMLPDLRKVLKDLVNQEVASVSNKKYLSKEAPEDLISGVIRMHSRGFGFVQPDRSDLYSQDIFIPRPFTQNAVDGDRVEVLINLRNVSDKGPEGKVVKIIERGRSHLAGIVREINWKEEIIAYVPLLGIQQAVVVRTPDGTPLRVGDRIVMKVEDWGDPQTETTCLLSHIIGHIDDASVDVRAATEEYELRADFPHEVVSEARSFPSEVTDSEISQRDDFTELECVTIDPDTAKDFDDALSLTKDRRGYHLGVHIADVSHYVQSNSELDKEARKRSNSTYFPGTCIPMLPEELSNHLCSLKPDVNRLTVSVLIDFDLKGNVKTYTIHRAVILSRKRFTYKEAKEVLDGKQKSPHTPLLKLMVELCQLLKGHRYERGSLEFAIPELALIVDDKGVPTGTEFVPYDITHQLVEEFMLKANEIVAKHLSEEGKQLPFRIHDEPAQENLKDFSMLANAFGFKLPENPKAKDLQALFDDAMKTPYGQFLATSYIRCMQLAIYSADNIGHYGLGLLHYCHFTSPIRRYVDLVVHRSLFNKSLDRVQLEDVALKCSEQERVSAKAENHVKLLKKLRYLKAIDAETPYKTYAAVITRVRHFGIYFELMELMIEGFIHVSEIGDDYYVFEEKSTKMVGSQSKESFFAGDSLTVRLRNLDLILLETHWEIIR